MKTHLESAFRALCGCMAILVCLMAGGAAKAQNQFSVNLNANAGILASSGSSNSVRNAMWNTQIALLMDFNSVALRVFNDENSTENITQVALTIGDDRFNFANFDQNSELIMHSNNVFGAAAAVAADPKIVVLENSFAFATTDGTNPQQVAAGADNADRVVIEFGDGGIQPGYSSIFELRFEFDDVIPLADRPTNEPLLGIANSVFPQHYPSYQRILFDTDAPNPPFFSDLIDLVDPSDNATLAVTYSNGEQTEPVALSDQVGVAPTSIVDPRHPAPNFITPEINGVVGIPEPTSLVLLASGFAGLASIRRRAR